MLTDGEQGRHFGATRKFSVIAVLIALLITLPGGGCQGAQGRDRPWEEPIETRAAASASGVDSERGGGYGTQEEDEAAEKGRQRAPEHYQSLRIHMNANPGSLNPLRNPSEWTRRIMMDNVFETLVRYRPRGGSKRASYEPGLAARWDVSATGREIRVILMDNARWQDGRPVTSLDVQFSLELAKSKRGRNSALRLALRDLQAVEIINSHQLRLRLERPNGYLLRALALVPILPEHVYGKARFDERGTWVGSGPYRVSRDGDSVRLARDPQYWGTAPAIDNVIFVRYRDAAKALSEAKEGRMDIVPELIREHYPEQLEVPGVARRFALLQLRPPVISYMVLNTGKSPFDDGRVREALSLLVNRKTLSFLKGGLIRSASGLVWPGGPGDADAAPEIVRNTARAGILLDAAGWGDQDGDGVRSKDGQRLMITVLVSDAERDGRDSLLASLRGAGFLVDLRVGAAAVLKNRLREGAFDLAFETWSGAADRDLWPLLGSSGTQNYGHYRSPVVDELLRSAEGALSPEKRRAALGTLAKLLARSRPVIALSAPNPQGLVSKKILGLVVWDGWFALRNLRIQETPTQGKSTQGKSSKGSGHR